MRYRLLRKADVRAVHELGRKDFGAQTEFSWDWSLDSIGHYCKRSFGLGIVCVEKDAIVGFILAQKDYSSQKPNVSWVTYVYVVPEWRRHNVGSSLLDRAGERLRRMGKTDLIADIYAENEGSIKFFTRRGFRVAERWLLLHRKL